MKTVKLLREQLESDELKDTLLDVYADPSMMTYETERYIHALDRFEEEFGDGPVHIFSAPGRTEVCGNHTDHQRGEVLAASINRDVLAIVRETNSGKLDIYSEGYGRLVIPLNSLDDKSAKTGNACSLIRGVAATVKNRGYNIGSFEAYITSDVLIGAGLSSSAAFETVIGTILSYLFNEGKISAIEIGIIGQIAENVYFGKPCGLMDQMACSVGGLIHINFKEKENPVVEKVPFPLTDNGYCLCITDTKGSHANLTPDYAAITEEMKAAAALWGKEVLSEIDEDELLRSIKLIKDKVNDRAALRVIHYVTENRRVRRAIEVLKSGDIDAFLNIENEAGDSSFKCLQNIYSASNPKVQGISIALAASKLYLKDDCYARVQGGGFAGTIQAYVKNELAKGYCEYMNSIFGDGSCNILKIRKYGGMQII
ncbi:MAG: galactokinase [Lachnospiraceae bacterium]|nr:galactokinase [Lachnospiraceae bacterium]